ncbi:GNAT family N-acetyltransferase [Amycolatopsis sp. NBC_01307]|uniref:GNAT family N-acetyltransferase n=1 Tax=Amycolatopsis sp. NBC_01307 TaxID=2903561 RepID=UPI002E1139F0|nr:GNAT family N-acetyltransferase [Amycolatopsis sp. NBC_01307]
MSRATVGGPASGTRGEYGELLPVRPATAAPPVVCLRGHYLALFGMIKSHSPRYRLHTTLCETCRKQEAPDPGERRLAEWAHLDVKVQHAPGAAPQDGLVLVAVPPAAGSATGKIELRLDGRATGTASLTSCSPCRTATLDDVHVEAAHRRLGYGRTLVSATLFRAPGYTWTAPVPDGPVARAFRARIALPRTGPLCVHRGK